MDTAALGYLVFAIGPHLPEWAKQHIVDKEGISLPVLCDVGNVVARSFRLDIQLPDEIRPVYKELGKPLLEANGDESHVLPVPATYVVSAGPDSRVQHAFLDDNYRRRADPKEVLAAVAAGAASSA